MYYLYLDSLYKTIARSLTDFSEGSSQVLSSSTSKMIQVATDTFQVITCLGAIVGYKIGSPILMNSMAKLSFGWSPQEKQMTDLHLATLFGTIFDVKAALAKGIDPNIKDRRGCTALLYCALSPVAKMEVARILIDSGADIYAEDFHGRTPLSAAQQPDVMRVLLGVERDPAFASCTKRSEFFEKMWPASRDSLPKDWKKWLRKTPREEKLINILYQTTAKGKAFPNPKAWRILFQDIPVSSLTLESIIERLIKGNHIFAKAWELANQSEKLDVIEIDEKYPDSLAYYQYESHSIHIANRNCDGTEKDLDGMIKSIVFELINALQRDDLKKIDQLAKRGELGREEWAFLNEHLENRTSAWTHYIINGTLSGHRSFLEQWTLQNELGHTENIRGYWDRNCAATYLSKQRSAAKQHSWWTRLTQKFTPSFSIEQ